MKLQDEVMGTQIINTTGFLHTIYVYVYVHMYMYEQSSKVKKCLNHSLCLHSAVQSVAQG